MLNWLKEMYKKQNKSDLLLEETVKHKAITLCKDMEDKIINLKKEYNISDEDLK